jgi:hypothetical protein
MGRDTAYSEEVTAYILRIPKINQNEHEAKYRSLSLSLSLSRYFLLANYLFGSSTLKIFFIII